ncbi:fumarylacetoacetate hydrolase family protein [Arenibaculum sp.]|uniref:fumarylacetoacetate hydrolase family protein n=1 Tax=Arenibaculum sp. TaxID=2865862 RepID=UPI002E168882|nr:fumarylacetoacetate hydrolase family protein [Arenibaculum sp.]
MVWFALASYRADRRTRAALVIGDRLYDLDASARALAAGEADPRAAWPWAAWSVDELIGDWPAVRAGVQALAARAAQAVRTGGLTALTVAAGDIAPPIRPQRVFCAASNFVEHAAEMGTVLAAKVDSRPYMFMKPGTAVIGQNEVVRLPARSEQVDWEVELGVVIGQRARNVSAANALDCVAGYTVVNDVSARDLNMRSDFPFKFDWFQGKCFDTFAPLGPWIVPSSLIADPQQLRLTLSVNGEVMQDDTTRAMIFDVREQIEYLSSILTLLPGDVIATGTPTGVGMGRGIYLKPGDVMEARIDGIGMLRNPVAAE